MAGRNRTSRETEIKLRVADLPALLRALRALGATLHGRVLERNTVYDTPDSDFLLKGRLLRLRVEEPAPSDTIGGGPRRAILTSKVPARDSLPARYKRNLERELELPRPSEAKRIFRGVGLAPRFLYEKYRTSFRLGGLHLDVDETPVGTFLEIEGFPGTIDRIARRLAYSPRDYIRRTYWDLYRAECARRGRPPRNMLFLEVNNR
jgi:adenylate cyclase, class 2